VVCFLQSCTKITLPIQIILDSCKVQIKEDVVAQKYMRNGTIQVIEVEEDVTKIDYEAFRECTSHQTIKLPETLQKIDYQVFHKCTLLQEITIPPKVKQRFLGDFSRAAHLTQKCSTISTYYKDM